MELSVRVALSNKSKWSTFMDYLECLVCLNRSSKIHFAKQTFGGQHDRNQRSIGHYQLLCIGYSVNYLHKRSDFTDYVDDIGILVWYVLQAATIASKPEIFDQ